MIANLLIINFYYKYGHVAEWLRRGLQILPSQFDSGRGLQNFCCFVYKKKYLEYNSSVAQLVEQLTVNQLVAGSSPARGANFLFNQSFLNSLCFLKLEIFFPSVG